MIKKATLPRICGRFEYHTQNELNNLIKRSQKIFIRWAGKLPFHETVWNDVSKIRDLKRLQTIVNRMIKYVGFAHVAFDMGELDDFGQKIGLLVDILNDGRIIDKDIELPL